MKYYILRHEDPSGKFVDGDVEFFPPLPDYYKIAQSVLPPETNIQLTLDKRVKKLNSHFFLTTCGAFFVSAPMREVLSKFKTSLAFHAAAAKYHNGKEVEGKYFLVHANSKLACFDYNNSEYSGKSMVLNKLSSEELPSDYQVRGIKKLCVVAQQAEEHDFFFVDKIIWIDPIISELLVASAKKQSIELNIELMC